MNKALEELRDIGTQKIHETTHIPRASIEAFINEDFSKMNKIQLNGFIAIFEREYGVDLSGLKKSGLTYVVEHENEKKVRTEFVSTKEKSSKLIYIVIGLIILMGAIYFTMFNEEEKAPTLYEEKSSIVQSVEKEIIPQIERNNSLLIQEANVTDMLLESNSSELVDNNTTELVEAAPAIVDTVLTVTQKSKGWFGYVSLDTHKKNSKTFRGNFDLNGSQDWLLIGRPGSLLFTIDEQEHKYKSSKNMRFKYIDKKLTKIRLAEWKKLNKGRTW